MMTTLQTVTTNRILIIRDMCCKKDGYVMISKQAGFPEIQPGPVIVCPDKLVSLKFVDGHLAREEFCSLKEMSAEHFSLRIPEYHMNVNERFAVTHADITLKVENLHASWKLERVVFLCVLVVECHHRMRRRADPGNAAKPDIFLLHELGHRVE